MSNMERTYLHALNNMSGTKPGALARVADRLAGDAFDRHDYGGYKAPTCNAMMRIEASIWAALCDANGVDWRCVAPDA